MFPAALIASFDSLLKGIKSLDVVEDHIEVLFVEGDSRSAESSCER